MSKITASCCESETSAISFRETVDNMKWLPALFLLALICFVSGGTLKVGSQAQTPQDPDDVIRTESDITNVLLTATDKQNRLLTTLREEDLRVLEDGAPQTLFTF